MKHLLVSWLVLFQAVAAPLSDPAVRFYDPAIVQDIHIDITRQDQQRLDAALPRRISVPATFRSDGQILSNVAVRYKGNSSAGPDSPHKRGYLVDFSEFQKGQRFLGLRHVALDNGIQFGSLFSERLITDILATNDIHASRCNYARLHLNGKFVGVYVNVERIDKSFLKTHFNEGKGILFKADEDGPGSDLRFLGDNPRLYRQAFELHAGREDESYSALLEFVRAVNRTESDLRPHLDLTAFLKTTAIMLFSGAFDQYTGWGAHNYYLYRSSANGRWTYLPWDLDVGFAEEAFSKVPVLDGWNAAWPAPVPDRVLMQRVINDPILLREYREQATRILDSSFKPDVLIPKLRALHAQIRDDLARDPFPARRATNPNDSSYESILQGMETFIRKRYESARAQLANPGQRPAATKSEGPQPGPASPDAPTELRLHYASARRVDLEWNDRAEGEVAYVVQRSESGKDADFRNAIGQMGHTITSASDQAVQPGKIYWYRVYAVFATAQGPRGSGVSNVIEVRVPEN